MRIKLVSTSNPDESYTIEVQKDPDHVSCTCQGFKTHGRCKHIKFYKHLIQGFLHEKPGFTSEKR